jgi:hypothetical protein
MKEKSNENFKNQSKTNIIGTHQTIMSKEAIVNFMNKQVMKKYPDHDYKSL